MHDAVAADRDLGRRPRRRRCRPVRTTRDRPDAELEPELTPRPPTSTWTRRWPRRSSRSRRTSPRAAGTSRPGSTRWSTPPSWSTASPRWPRRWGWTPPPREGSLTPVEQDQLAAGPAARDRAGVDRAGRADVAGCAAVVERLVLPPGRRRRDPRGPGRGRGVRPRAPRPAGGADRRRASPAPGRRTVPCGCAPTTTTSRWSAARTWCPGCWRCCGATLEDDGGSP